ARAAHTATALSDGRVLVVAGLAVGGTKSDAELYDPASNTWMPAGPMDVATRAPRSATPLPGGQVLVTFGVLANDLPWAWLNAEIWTPPPSPSPDGAPCSSAAQCQSGFCIDGVCCNTSCSADTCGACSVAAGGAVDGICSPLSGTPCNRGNLCMQGGTCPAGMCTGAEPVVCVAPGPCTTARCGAPAGHRQNTAATS